MIEEAEQYDKKSKQYENALMKAAQQICKNLPSAHPLRVFLHLKHGPYPFYEGGFANNLKEGQGTVKNKDGSIYRGEWSKDKKHGKGEMFYANGDTYDGNWQNGKKAGQGTYHFAGKGCSYRGEWVDGKITNGEWTMDDGVAYRGEGFNNNLPDGNGYFTFPESDHINLHGKFVNTEWIPSSQYSK
jgi:hypothetical protein